MLAFAEMCRYNRGITRQKKEGYSNDKSEYDFSDKKHVGAV
jgi:hypothetical protein